jgi:hypothetical protein
VGVPLLVVVLPTCTYHLLPYPFGITFAGTDNLNHELSQHREAAERAAKKDCQSISATKMSLVPPTEPTRPSK